MPAPEGELVSVDAAGAPVGNQRLPLGVLPSAVQTALKAATPSGATALTDTSVVGVRTAADTTTYSARLTVSSTARPTLGPALSLFASAATNTTVATDPAALKAAAVKALRSTLAADQKALRSDTVKYSVAIHADQAAIRKGKSNATDQAAALAALSADLNAVRAVPSAYPALTQSLAAAVGSSSPT